jgi:hypothetical protein
MTDIVERLRDWPATAPRKDAFSSHFVGDMLTEAADEIERQRGYVETLKKIVNEYSARTHEMLRAAQVQKRD